MSGPRRHPVRKEGVEGQRVRDRRETEPEAADGHAIHRAFHRLAFLFANLVCGIWLILLTVLVIVDPERPDVGSLILVLLLSAPIAYAIPYGVMRLAGSIVVALRRRQH